MANQVINGVLFEFSDHQVESAGDEPVKAFWALAEKGVAELEKLGVKVDRVVGSSLEEPPRYYISFDPQIPMFKTRLALEKELWDVGQQLGTGGKNISFYVTRRVTRSKGWEV